MDRIEGAGAVAPAGVASMTGQLRSSLDSQLRVLFWIALVVMTPIVFFFTTEGTWNALKRHTEGGWTNHFFVAQAQAMIHGQLDVPRDEIRGECLDRDNRCYGYFGITPSVLRLPLFLRERWAQSGLTPLYVGCAVLLGYWAALRLLFRSLREVADRVGPRLTLGYAAAGALALGPGSTLLFVTRPAVYEEAIAWGLAFIMFTLDRVAAWYRTNTRRDLILAVVFGIAAANARPTGAPACAVLGGVIIALALLERSRRQAVALGLCLMLLPGLTASGVFWAKFRTPMADLRLNEQFRETPWWQDILRRNGNRTFSLIFVPTELVVYLRPDSVSFSREWPFVGFRFPIEPILWLPPLPPGGAYVNEHEPFTSVTTTMPFAAAVTLLVTIWLGVCAWRRARHDPSPVWGEPPPTLPDWTMAAGALASAAAMVAFVVSTVGIVNRYLGDFYPVMAVGVALGAGVVLPQLARRPRAIAPLGYAAVVLVAWSIFATCALNHFLVFE